MALSLLNGQSVDSDTQRPSRVSPRSSYGAL